MFYSIYISIHPLKILKIFTIFHGNIIPRNISNYYFECKSSCNLHTKVRNFIPLIYCVLYLLLRTYFLKQT